MAITTNSSGTGASGLPELPTPATEAPADVSGVAALRSTLAIRAFRRLWLVLGLSSLGDWVGLLATSTFAGQQFHGSAAQGAAFGSVIAVRMLPALVLGPVAGVIADRWDRRYTMVVCDLIRFLFFASIPAATLVTSDNKAVVGWTVIATFVIESVQMGWAPAKEASVPNLLPKARLETANQLTLATTYGITPVIAGLLLAGANTVVSALYHPSPQSPVSATHIALYFDAATFLATALVVCFGIREISGRAVQRPAKRPSVLHEFVTGWAYVARTPLVRGLVLGILGAFGGAGVVIGTAQLYAQSLSGGYSTFYILFAVLFIGLGIGIVGGPRMVGALSRRRWFGLSIVLAAVSVTVLAFAWHLALAVVAAVGVGVGAGMAFLSGTTLLYRDVTDDVRGRVFAFIQTATQVVLLLTISVSSVLVGVGGSRRVLGLNISTTRPLLLAAGVFGMVAGVIAFRQMDDKRGVPIFADLWSSVRGRPIGVAELTVGVGRFIVFEGGEGAGKSTQVRLLADRLLAQGREVVVTREPGATEAGAQIRTLLLSGGPESLAPRAEALLYAADRAHHVASVVRPAIERGAVVISDRYVDSSIAYQGAGRTLPVEEVKWLSKWATGGLKPDLVVLLDIEPEEGLRRVARRGAGNDRLEQEELPFHDRVRYAFLDLARAEPSRYLVLDADRPAKQVAALVAERVEQILLRSPGGQRGGGGTPPPPRMPGIRRGRARRVDGGEGPAGEAGRPPQSLSTVEASG